MEKTEKIAGIIGGMGPEATVDLMRRIIKNTPALDDIDHVHCLVDNNPHIPSRIKALIEGSGESPGPAMAQMARGLEQGGADFLCIACNTAHNYYREVREAVSIPVLNMITLAVDGALQETPSARKIGLLCSPAVRTTRLYTDALEARGVEAVYPDLPHEARLLDVIKEIKKGNTGARVREELSAVVAHLGGRGIGAAIVACTELGIITDGERYAVPMPDAAEILALAVVRKAKNR